MSECRECMQAERDLIVAWIRCWPRVSSFDELAKAIENGEHLPPDRRPTAPRTDSAKCSHCGEVGCTDLHPREDVIASETGPLVTLREAAEDAYTAWIETDDPHNSADLRTAMAVLCDVLDGAHVHRKVETARASET